jgi:HSP20 family molecular chaperone IbpA
VRRSARLDADSAKASFRDGVLDICFDAPKGQQQRGRRLHITEDPSTASSRIKDLPA